METLLKKGLAELGLDCSGTPPLLRYGELLLETNKVMNLTAITEPKDVATLHFLDSAALHPTDAAGFPGQTDHLFAGGLR